MTNKVTIRMVLGKDQNPKINKQYLYLVEIEDFSGKKYSRLENAKILHKDELIFFLNKELN